MSALARLAERPRSNSSDSQGGRYWTRNIAETGGKIIGSSESGAESGALDTDSATLADPDLAWIAASWKGLSADVKARFLALITGH
jgi:hypothetical protein